MPKLLQPDVSVRLGDAFGADTPYSVTQAAVKLAMSRVTLYELVQARQIGYKKLGFKIVICQSHIDRFLADCEVPPI